MNVAVIIQGRSTNFDKLVDSFSNCNYKVLFCGWEGEDIKSKGNIEVLLLKKPSSILPRYCNYQSEGVLAGIDHLSKNNYTHFLKLRWDMIPHKDDINKFIELFISKYSNKPIFYSISLNSCSMIQDWILFGTQKDHTNYWKIHGNDVHGLQIAEHIFFVNFVKSNNLDINLKDLGNINLLLNYLDFICKEIIQNNIRIDIFVGNEGYKSSVDIKHYGTVDTTHIVNY